MNTRLLFPGSVALALLLSACQPSAGHALPANVAPNGPLDLSAPKAAAVAPTALTGTPAPFAAAPLLPGTVDVATLAARVKPSVVNITTVHVGTKPTGFGDAAPYAARALGSGFIVDPRGLVVTNAHVVEGADRVRVKLADEREFEAKVKGRDARLDLALLELVGAKDLPAVSLGSSEALKVGEYVVAIGNPFGLGHTVTMGIVSAKGRTIGAGPYDDFVQTDAAINPGNSGGPLFDVRGQVVGINTAINPEGKGIGFAIPVDALQDVLPQLIAKGHVERGRLGVAVQTVDAALAKALGLESAKGALIGEIEKGGPADRSGLAAGDLILAVDERAIEHSVELPRTIARHAPGEKVALKVLRAKKERLFDVVLDALKDQAVEASDASADPADPADDKPTSKLGVGFGDAPDGGALIRRVEPMSPADGELVPGDVVIEADGAKIPDADAFRRAIKAAPSGKAALLKVRRHGKVQWVGVELR